MTKAELLQELGPPRATLGAGNREVLDYGSGRKAQFLNGRVFNLVGFPDSIVSEGQVPDPIKTARTSTERSAPTTSANINSQNAFVDFDSINNQRKETFTLSSSNSSEAPPNSSPSIRERIQPLITYVTTMDRQTLTLRGFGIGASFALAILTSLILKRRSASKKKSQTRETDSELPPILAPKLQEKPSILDQREPPKLRSGESRTTRKDPVGHGLSIRGPIYQDYDPDYDPNAPRRQLVGAHTAPKNNNAYSSAHAQSSVGEPEPQESTPSESQKSSSLKLKLSED